MTDKFLFMFHIGTQWDDKICLVIAESEITAKQILVVLGIRHQYSLSYDYKVKVSSNERCGLKKIITIENENYEG